MALIKCKECGHKVSDTAKTCVNCGYDLKKDKSSLLGDTYNVVDGVGQTAGCLSSGCVVTLIVTVSAISSVSFILSLLINI
ncbi:zinc ribbon domain-containing protein [uncultured Aquimarina sp.]|uniref:zinc ribbon domain-containing protein n=1 Tax=uncultured Aquimarina sp. TaxID=575652 RepID=UPI00263021C5|nr:zinc ribbon domain-containing protein [uncultured Aquimarina sp.]